MYLRLTLISLLALFTLSACQTTDADPTPFPTEVVEISTTPEPAVTIDPSITDEPQATEEPQVTEEPVGVEVALTLVPGSVDNSALSADGSYGIVVQRGELFGGENGAEVGENLPALEEGQQFVVVTATLENLSDDRTFELVADQLTLIDSEGERYAAITEGVNVAPVLYGDSLAPGANLLGFVVFSIPESTTPETIEWCPGENCTDPVQSSVELVNNDS